MLMLLLIVTTWLCCHRSCAQVVPHITDAIQDWIERVAHTAVDGRDGLPDVCIIELGGTVRGWPSLLACLIAWLLLAALQGAWS